MRYGQYRFDRCEETAPTMICGLVITELQAADEDPENMARGRSCYILV